jgi:hypothetical protein
MGRVAALRNRVAPFVMSFIFLNIGNTCAAVGEAFHLPFQHLQPHLEPMETLCYYGAFPLPPPKKKKETPQNLDTGVYPPTLGVECAGGRSMVIALIA